MEIVGIYLHRYAELGVNVLFRPDCVLLSALGCAGGQNSLLSEWWWEHMAEDAPITEFSLRQVLRGGQGEWDGHLPRI